MRPGLAFSSDLSRQGWLQIFQGIKFGPLRTPSEIYWLMHPRVREPGISERLHLLGRSAATSLPATITKGTWNFVLSFKPVTKRVRLARRPWLDNLFFVGS